MPSTLEVRRRLRQSAGGMTMHRCAPVTVIAVGLGLLLVARLSAAVDLREAPAAVQPRPPHHHDVPRPGGSGAVAYALEFSDYAGGAVEDWLRAKGLGFEEAAKSRDLLHLAVGDGALILEAREALRGFLVKDALEVQPFSTVRIEWGVLKYPAGASYEKGVRNEAIMVFIFFGTERLSSGHLLYPDLPYFIGLYLCETDELHKPYTGKSYQEGGRYVCVGNPPPQTTVVSEFDLRRAFQAYFAKDDVPPISGIAIEVDTSSSGDGGTAAAFIKRLEIRR
jgi:hypothetical protein